jgi:acetyl esterase/lipase
MRNSIVAFGLALACCPAAPCTAAETGIAYGPRPTQLLDICRPRGLGPRAPALLMIHGGGWRSGTRTAQAGVCQLVAQAGVMTIPVEYTLVTPQPETKWPMQLNDVQLAMRWVRAHAAELGIDPNRICAQGDSAGAQLALMLDVTTSIAAGPSHDLLRGVSPRANCAISISGPTDMLAIETAHPHYADFLVGAGDPASVLARKRDASPALHVAPGDGPALLIHGIDDPFVPFAQAEEIQQAFARVGTPAWLISHPGGHEFGGLSGAQGHAAWLLMGTFVRANRVGGAPGLVKAEDILQ